MVEPRLVVSLTTIPSRSVYLPLTIETLLAQTRAADEILISYPTSFAPAIDETILTSHPSIRLVRGADQGPGTKLLGALEYLGGSDALIVTVDDDVLYDRRLLEVLLAEHERYPEDALGFRGFLLDARGGIALPGDYRVHRFVDVLEGWSGALYARRFFERGVEQARERCASCFFVDDVWISGYLSERGVARRLITTPDGGLRRPRLSPGSAIDSLHDHQDNVRRNSSCAGYFDFGKQRARTAAPYRLPRVRRTLGS